MNTLNTIPYWDEDDDEELPEGIIYGISEVAPAAGYRGNADLKYLSDESGQFNFPCFSERL